MSHEIERNRKTGLIGTILFHAILVAVVIFFGFRTPLPLPAEEGVLVNFGYDEEGFGESEPMESEPQNVQQEVSEPVTEEQTYQTQDFEEAPEINQEAEVISKPKEDIVEKPKENQEVKNEEPDPVEKVEEVVEKPRTVDTRSLFPGKSNSESTGEGNTSGQGNMGDPDGGSEGEFSGVPGGGGGGGWSLSGRTALHISKPENKLQKYGTVVVAITVNKDGVVTEAIPGVKGTTIVDDYLYDLARKAAISSKFNRKPYAPPFQKGFITYHFSAN